VTQDAPPRGAFPTTSARHRWQGRAFRLSSSAVTRLNPVLRRGGMELVRSAGERPWSHRLNRVVLPVPFQEVPRNEAPLKVEGSRPFTVPLERCTTPYGFSYSSDGWHPLVAALSNAGGTRKEMRGFLREFYGGFSPRTLLDLFAPGEPLGVPQLARWPASPPLVRRLWAANPWWLRRHLYATPAPPLRDHASVYMGPKSPTWLDAETDRLLEVFESIGNRGYRPAGHGHRIAGFFLVNGDSYRFVLLSGNHRVAALRALGHDHCVATFYPGWPYAVHHDGIDRWTVHRGGIYEPETARWLFARLHGRGGSAVGQRLGLYDERSLSTPKVAGG
jgi:hypothetical protein